MKALPLTPNGKVDRTSLPEPLGKRLIPEARFAPPETDTQERLAAIWMEVLGQERIGIDDNFFTLGGHSLKATQVVSRIREAFEIEMPLRNFFAASTISGLAKEVERRVGAEAPKAPHAGPATDRDVFEI